MSRKPEIQVGKLAHSPKIALISLSGAIFSRLEAQLIEEWNLLIQEGYLNIIFDFKNVEFINSSISIFVSLADAMENSGGLVLLARMNSKIHTLFDMLGLVNFFKIFPNLISPMTFIQKNCTPQIPLSSSNSPTINTSLVSPSEFLVQFNELKRKGGSEEVLLNRLFEASDFEKTGHETIKTLIPFLETEELESKLKTLYLLSQINYNTPLLPVIFTHIKSFLKTPFLNSPEIHQEIYAILRNIGTPEAEFLIPPPLEQNSR